jgi:phage tail-like protein
MSGETQTSTWPLPKFHFSVQLGNGIAATFQEVTGLDAEPQPIAYRHGDDATPYPVKMPGLGKVGNVILRRGIFGNDTTLWDWFKQVQMNTVARQTVVITLLDESAVPKRVWTLNNACPTKITGTDLKSEGNEIAVESVDIAFETMVISAP